MEGRGWISDDTDKLKATNTTYYLYTSKWYLSMSPYNLNEQTKGKVVFIGAAGDLNGFWIGDWGGDNGGVQF